MSSPVAPWGTPAGRSVTPPRDCGAESVRSSLTVFITGPPDHLSPRTPHRPRRRKGPSPTPAPAPHPGPRQPAA
ncbi:hypothetical protein QR98_0018870, partial [Sarcoptes scabiei]